MLDFKKCKEVVEEVWGWVWHPDGEVPSGNEWEWQGRWITPEKTSYYGLNPSAKVNSWEGFGRTVEAMEKRGYFLAGGYGGDIVFLDIKGEGRLSHALHFEETSEDFRDATHLAALEAVRSEK